MQEFTGIVRSVRRVNNSPSGNPTLIVDVEVPPTRGMRPYRTAADAACGNYLQNVSDWHNRPIVIALNDRMQITNTFERD